jgi:hypothetical protein
LRKVWVVARDLGPVSSSRGAAGRDIQVADEGHDAAAQLDDALNGCLVVWRKRLECEYLRFRQQGSQWIIDLVPHVERDGACRRQLLGRVFLLRTSFRPVDHGF